MTRSDMTRSDMTRADMTRSETLNTKPGKSIQTPIPGNTITTEAAATAARVPHRFVRDLVRRQVIFSMLFRDHGGWRVSRAAVDVIRAAWNELDAPDRDAFEIETEVR